ncbi:MAG TPA: prephenate dehydrogenase [Bacteroidota bacterium]|nr:prephenate dehydrogenase [Bacteroidota bacterium]
MSRSRQFPTITIIGLGVIGGSLGLALKQSNPGVKIVGFDEPDVLRTAKKRKAIDRAASSLKDALSRADFVFMCTPVSAIVKMLPNVSRFIMAHAIVTDVGSVKGVIDAAARKYFSGRGVFVGGHPMAGSEGSGMKYADPLLFQNAAYVLCPLRNDRRAVQPLVRLLKSIGAHILMMDAREHDRVAASVSHLPQLLAVSLMDFAAGKNKESAAFLQLAAGGFRDMTRIASSPFPIWKDILQSNRREVKGVLREFRGAIKNVDAMLNERTLSSMGKKFVRAKSFRDEIPKNSKGFLHSLHDLFVWVDDKPGVLAKMTAALYKKGININDIELLKVREGRGGTFRLSFESGEAAASAAKVLRAKGIRVVT